MNNIIKLSLQNMLLSYFIEFYLMSWNFTMNALEYSFFSSKRIWDIFLAAETPARLYDHTEYLSSFSSIENFFEVCLCSLLFRGDLKWYTIYKQLNIIQKFTLVGLLGLSKNFNNNHCKPHLLGTDFFQKLTIMYCLRLTVFVMVHAIFTRLLLHINDWYNI